MVREVDVRTFAAAHADGAHVIDVREPFEYMAGHVPGARLVPLGSVAQAAPDLPTGRPVYVICASGNRSRTAALWLARAGIDARSVAGGTAEWAQAGFPVVPGSRENAA
ncbi:MAG TPA: rhodanese-like domain-containing protein [Acidimicrobiales bacterium]|nr:rhodanese-like domain-containing protein [Acidimicrobiales bacterium]